PSSLVARHRDPRALHSFPTRRSSDLLHCGLLSLRGRFEQAGVSPCPQRQGSIAAPVPAAMAAAMAAASPCPQRQGSIAASRRGRSEEHTSELQSRENLVCRLLLEKKK